MHFPIVFNEDQRLIAAAAVEASVYKIAKHFGMSVERCLWNCDTGMNHSGPHRMDIHISGLSIRTYISDDELAAYWSRQNTGDTDVRLYHLLNGLHDLIEELAWADLPQHCWTPMTRNICANGSKKRTPKRNRKM